MVILVGTEIPVVWDQKRVNWNNIMIRFVTECKRMSDENPMFEVWMKTMTSYERKPNGVRGLRTAQRPDRALPIGGRFQSPSHIRSLTFPVASVQFGNVFPRDVPAI
jgi:hypothetical protein